VLFNLALTLGLQDDPIAALGAAIRLVEKEGHEQGIEFPMQGTVAVSDGETTWAFRYSSRHNSRTLYHSVDWDTLHQMYPDAERLNVFGKKAQLVVSEPLNDLPGVFTEIPESTVLVMKDGEHQQEPFLAA
jgi:glutamine amidotransferase